MGYVVIRVNKIQKYVKIANLVAEYFLPAPQNENFVLVRINYLLDDNRACNLKWVTKKERCALKKHYNNKHTDEKVKEEQSKTAIVQLRSNGEYVRRYYDVNEILSVHPTWQKEDILKCLSGESKDVYGWKFLWESDYEKR